MSAWAELADRLRNRYPDDWADRYASYKDGANPDVQRWRNIGGERYVPSRRPPPTSDPTLAARNRRIVAAARTGTPLCLMAERFGLTTWSIREILSQAGERAIR